MANARTSRKGLKICGIVTAIFIAILVIVITTLSLTIFKPKDPDITANPVGLRNISFSSLNVTIDMMVTIDNRNYGSFKFQNSTAYINYRGDIVAEVPLEEELVPARGKINITTSAVIEAEKLIINPNFWNDVEAGSLNMTSTATLHGQVNVFKIFKLHARTVSICSITIWIDTQSLESKCRSKVKL
ncbi:hypothetical protein Pint_02057 [Pistacia integerrima]|uniref:Uncharacterized protein n=1 Tax=Pistacia integerrima TaxID=434235 RepID=A0ACC0ZJS7_9ROSI|nr:hypothetical protein Pint_02057 [Pistacia integerrima]